MKKRVPAVDGWLNIDPAHPRLIGTKCSACGSIFFPREAVRCRNPRCGSPNLEATELSARGTLWSYTGAEYQPPEPYVPRTNPFQPFAIAAVELAAEKMVVLGQVDGVGVKDLKIGMEMELTLDTLLEDDETETITWKWKPVSGGSHS
ncbi:MAG: hypothetical protein JWM91_4998 [Rhodospirillales bacterium]|nr:hypothetical protein [Rhodospirillales bacterium]